MNADLNGLRVLVLEDETLVSMLLEDMLADLGCVVVGPYARTRQAAAFLEGGGQADVAILDVNVAGETSTASVSGLR